MEKSKAMADRFINSVQENEGQERRYERAMQAECTPDFVDIKNQTACFPGREEEGYKTSLEECSCPDYEKRDDHLPCKHMYRLAMELRVLDEYFDYGLNINKKRGNILNKYDLLSMAANQLYDHLYNIYKQSKITFFIMPKSQKIRELALCGLVEIYTGPFYPVFSNAHESTFIKALQKTGFLGKEEIREVEFQMMRKLVLKWENECYQEFHKKLTALILTYEGQINPLSWDVYIDE